MSQVHIINHPLIQHKLTIMRDRNTGSKDFRTLLKEISLLMGYEISRDLPLEDKEIETPVARMTGKEISGQKLAIVPILRAGLGMYEGLVGLIPVARVGFIGLYRDSQTHKPVPYYFKMPHDITNRMILLTDPMLATGGSAVAAIQMLKDKGCKKIRFMCLIAVPEGIKAVQDAHPDVDIYVAAVDERLNENDYIVPGIGDAGDRIFGTE